MHRSGRQKIRKDIVELNTTDRLYVTDIYRLFYPTTEQYNSSHAESTKTDHILRHKTHKNKFKIEITQSLVSDYKGIKLENGNRKIAAKPKNTLVNNQKISRNFKII